MGTDIRPSRKPMAWDTSLAPTSSKAMGAMMLIKQPSNSPISRHTAIRPPNTLHSGIIMDMRPITKKEVTWRAVREAPSPNSRDLEGSVGRRRSGRQEQISSTHHLWRSLVCLAALSADL